MEVDIRTVCILKPEEQMCMNRYFPTSLLYKTQIKKSYSTIGLIVLQAEGSWTNHSWTSLLHKILQCPLMIYCRVV